MSEEFNISDETLNLYLDDQLDSVDMDRVHRAIKIDQTLAEKVCDLKEVRDLVNYAYQTVPAPLKRKPEKHRLGDWVFSAVAALILVFVGAVGGWFLHENPGVKAPQIVNAYSIFDYYKSDAAPGISQGEPRYIIHVSSGNDHAIRVALDETESLLSSHLKRALPLRLEVMANRDITMLRDDSPYKNRILEIMESYSNVTFLACARTINNTESREGKPVRLIQNTVSEKSAREHIPVRLQQGWVYLKV